MDNSILLDNILKTYLLSLELKTNGSKEYRKLYFEEVVKSFDKEKTKFEITRLKDILFNDNFLKYYGFGDGEPFQLTDSGKTAAEINWYKNALIEKNKEIKHTIIHGGQVIINEQSNNGNQSLSDKALASPTIQKIKKTTDKNPKKSWIELLSWIIGSIASIFAIYEFIIKRIFENNINH